ncbi:hypothetical protein P7K49_014823 [Saguinus oedipus]|uniref:Uncharacterized protein n=1 Tax=Saguinus oedipus TaxID=9490 RepID=A0ABQ9V8R6_SAGOE|nr:hypothetical protein P7K49_014823 [Saguinus oedipus]
MQIDPGERKNDPYALASLVSFEVKKMPYKDQPAKLPEGSMADCIFLRWPQVTACCSQLISKDPQNNPIHAFRSPGTPFPVVL